MRAHLGARTNPLRDLLLSPFAIGAMVTLQSGSLLEDLSIAAGGSDLGGAQSLV